MSVLQVLEIIGVAVGVSAGIAGIGAAVWAVGRLRGIEASIEIFREANGELREANADLRLQLATAERECSDRISRLEGQNEALLDGLGDKVAAAIAGQLEGALSRVAARVVDEFSQRATDRERRFSTVNQEGTPR